MRSSCPPDRVEQNLAYARRILTSGGSGTCKNKYFLIMNSGFGKCKFPCRPTQLFAFRNSRSVSALFSQVSSSPFCDFVEKVINLSAQDKRFPNAILRNAEKQVFPLENSTLCFSKTVQNPLQYTALRSITFRPKVENGLT